MILASTIHSIILSRLDAEGSDRYTFDQTTKYAINAAQDTIVTALNQAFAENKLSPEALRELSKVKVWQTNSYSRVSFDDTAVGHKLWSIIAVFPNPKTTKKSTFPSNTETTASKFMSNVSLVSPGKPAKRITMEEAAEVDDNAFAPGNSIIKGKLQEFAYLDFADYTSSVYPGGADKKEITIYPFSVNKFIAISYLKYPTPIASLSDQLEFPSSITELLVQISLSKIAEKQGDQTNLWGITTQNINNLVGLIK